MQFVDGFRQPQRSRHKADAPSGHGVGFRHAIDDAHPIGKLLTARNGEIAAYVIDMFIYFVGLTLASYVRSVWQKDDVLRKKFPSTEVVLAEMHTIRCIEHTGR